MPFISDRFVHIVDDDLDVRKSTRFLLRSHGIESMVFDSGRDFLSHSRLDRGVILLDLRMDDLDGLQVLEALRGSGCQLPVVLVSGHGDIRTAVDAMKLGAIDFVEKPYDNDNLIAILERALAVDHGDSEHCLAMMSAARKVDALTPRQREILQGMVAGQSNKVMARRFGLSPRTIETHRAHMLDKLEVSNISDAIRIANYARLPDIRGEAKSEAKAAGRKDRLSAPRQGQLALS